MKARVIISLLSLFICGCPQSSDTGYRSALDRVRSGKDIAFGHCVLHVEKRQGSSLEGVRIVSKDPGGQTAMITAEKASLSQGPDKSFITVILHNPQIEKANQKASAITLVVNLPVSGL